MSSQVWDFVQNTSTGMTLISKRQKDTGALDQAGVLNTHKPMIIIMNAGRKRLGKEFNKGMFDWQDRDPNPPDPLDSHPFEWSNLDPDPSDLDPVNPPRGAGFSGSNGSKCDLCAYNNNNKYK